MARDFVHVSSVWLEALYRGCPGFTFARPYANGILPRPNRPRLSLPTGVRQNLAIGISMPFY